MVLSQSSQVQGHARGSEVEVHQEVDDKVTVKHGSDAEEEAFDQTDDDVVFQQIEDSIQNRRASNSTLHSEADYEVKTSEDFTAIPYGFQPRSAYEHFKKNTDVIGIAYNGRMRQFVILDHKGVTTWKKDSIDSQVSRAMNYPRYEYRLITSILYVKKYNVYFCLGKDFSLKVMNKDFEETCSVSADMRSVLFMIFNPVRDELITGGVGGTKIWCYHRVADKSWGQIKAMANYKLSLKNQLSNVGGSWVKRVEIDLQLQHLYCCSDMDLFVYDMEGNLLYKFLSAHSMSITAVVYSPYARLILTTSADTEMKAWTVAGGLIHTFRGHSRAVTNVVLHPDTSSLVITSSLDGSLRMWSLDTMDVLYSIVVSTLGVFWMGLTDDKLLYVGTSRNITVWSLNNVTQFWALARNRVTGLSLVPGEGKSTRVMAVGEDSSVRIFSRGNKKNLSTVLPPPSLSPLQRVRCVSYNRVINVVFMLVDARELWVYTTRTDPSCRIAVWDLLAIQKNCLKQKYEAVEGESGAGGRSSGGAFSKNVVTHRATEHGQGNEGIADCCCVCYLDSTAIMWTEEGFACPLRQNYLLFGLEDGRVLFMDPVVKGQKYMEFQASKDAIMDIHHDRQHNALITKTTRKSVSHFQIWSLPELELQSEVYCSQDVNAYARINDSFMTGHESGSVQVHHLVAVNENIHQKQKTVGELDLSKLEHQVAVVAVDACHHIQIFVSCSSDGAVKVWNPQKLLLTEVALDDSLTSACFLNNSGDLLVGYLNHIFVIDHTKICPLIRAEREEYETESDIYEDPAVLYEGVGEDPDPVNLHSYLVPFDIEFSKDFIEGKRAPPAEELEEEEKAVSESEMSMAPTDTYLSPFSSPRRLSLVDMTLTSDIDQYDLVYRIDYETSRKTSQLPRFGCSPGPSPSPSPPSTPATPSSLSVSEGGESTEDEADMQEEEKKDVFKPIQPAETQTQAEVVKVKPKVPEVKKDEPVEPKVSRFSEYRVDAKSLMKVSGSEKPAIVTAKPGVVKEASHSHALKVEPPARVGSASSGKRSLQKKEAKSVRRMPKRSKTVERSAEPTTARRASQQVSAAEDRKPRRSSTVIKKAHPTTVRRADVRGGESEEDEDSEVEEVIGMDIKARKFGVDAQAGSASVLTYQPGKKHPIEFNEAKPRPALGISPTAQLDEGDHGRETVQDGELHDGNTDSAHIPADKGASAGKLVSGHVTSGWVGQDVDKTRPPSAVVDGEDVVQPDDHSRPQSGQKKRRVKSASMLRLQKSPIIPVDAQSQRPARGSSARQQRSLADGSSHSPDRGTTPGGESLVDFLDDEYERVLHLQKCTEDYLSFELECKERWSPEGRAKSRAEVDALLVELMPWGMGGDGWSDSEDEDRAGSEKRVNQLLTDEEKRKCFLRPMSSQPARPNTPADGRQRSRSYSAHASGSVYENLQMRFEMALKRYLSRAEAPEKLYRNDGMKFDQGWPERMIERHLLLQMQKEVRSQNAAQKRHLLELRQRQRRKSLLGHRDCSKPGGPSVKASRSHPSILSSHNKNESKSPFTPAPSRASTAGRSRAALTPQVPTVTITRTIDGSTGSPSASFSRPQTAVSSYSLPQSFIDGRNSSSQSKAAGSNNRNVSPQSVSSRPKSAYSQYKEDEGLAASKSFRMRIQPSLQLKASKPASSQVDVRWIDPRNPQAVRQPGSKSIPSKCSRYILITHPKENPSLPIPTPLEEQLLNERFPMQRQRWLQQLEQVHGMSQQPTIHYAPAQPTTFSPT